MSCQPCKVAGQVLLNIALSIDRLLNSVLLGSGNETLSQRTARARQSGERWAIIACRILTLGSRLFGANGDHCTNSLTPGTLAAEVWHWSPPISQSETLKPSSKEIC